MHHTQTRRKAKLKDLLIRENGFGKGGVVYNLLANIDVKSIVVAGHGPAYAREVSSFLNNYKQAIIYCFEPDSRNWEEVKDLYGERVNMFNMALGTTDGIVEFFETPHKGQSSLLEWKTEGPSRTEVQSVTLDSFAESQDLTHINHLFLDVQGAEHFVFRGAKNLLYSHSIDIIIGEAILTNAYGTPESFFESYRLLHTAGYILAGVHEMVQNAVYGNTTKFDYIFTLPNLL
jgi:FkbM family methyltransferase